MHDPGNWLGGRMKQKSASQNMFSTTLNSVCDPVITFADNDCDANDITMQQIETTD
jgi:hypothetical protein